VIEVECEARDPEAIEHCIQLLQEADFKVDRASLD
jgi:UPF0288 family protein (methanogenesis marker protein 3)